MAAFRLWGRSGRGSDDPTRLRREERHLWDHWAGLREWVDEVTTEFQDYRDECAEAGESPDPAIFADLEGQVRQATAAFTAADSALSDETRRRFHDLFGGTTGATHPPEP